MMYGELVGAQTETDFHSFDELYAAFLDRLDYLSECAMQTTDYLEAHYDEFHAAPFMSATYTSALDSGKDIYLEGGARYNNSSVNAVGLGTAVDSLVAIKKMVFEDKILTLSELVDVLKRNWQGYEALRLTAKNRFRKFGTGDREVDAIAADIVDRLAKKISKRPNKKGGIYRLGLFSINWRWEFGEKCAASADGRLAGETVSQNTSATFGADREGATAHLTSVAAIDTSNTPNGAIVDIDLHSSSVKGKNGLLALTSSLKAYFRMGGFAVHYNVMNTDVLRDAMENPEKYPNLQVRLCGWNVLFSSLTDKEKEEFIARSVKE